MIFRRRKRSRSLRKRKKLMIEIMRELSKKILRFLARAVLRRRRPQVIAVTGSMGKTTAKEALRRIYARSGRQKNLPAGKNFNNEIGVPLAIIGVETPPGKSLSAWLTLSARWLGVMIWKPDYPSVLILEFGIDRPGDMDYLTEMVPVDIGVVTAVAEVHSQFLGEKKAIAREKGKLVEALPPGATAVLNADDPLVRKMASRTKAKVMTFGFDSEADVVCSDVKLSVSGGLGLKINYRGRSVPLRLPGVIGTQLLPSICAAVAAALAQGLNLVEITESLRGFTPPPGRGALLPGKKDTAVVDDTYNAPWRAVRELLRLPKRVGISFAPGAGVVVILGDILELGEKEERLHRALAEDIVAAEVREVFLVGTRMKALADELRSGGFPPERLAHFLDPVAAAEAALKKLRGGDLVLVKGSQGMRMEKAVEKLVALSESEKRKLLCRQDSSWRRKPFVLP